jgi:hypothetical protein
VSLWLALACLLGVFLSVDREFQIGGVKVSKPMNDQ